MPTCDDVRAEFIGCMQKSPCMAENGNSIQTCMLPEYKDQVPEECVAIHKAFNECKKSLLNMRYRFRGPKTTHS